MILPPAIYSLTSLARFRTHNEASLALQFSVAHSFQGMEPGFHEVRTLNRDEHNREPLDAILRRANALAPGPATAECADPELIAAYYDRSLVQSERDLLEAHFADCARCQSQLAAIARADERAGEARPAFGIAWLRRWQIAIPALAAVAAVGVAIVVMRPGNGESRRAQQIAMAKREAALEDLAARAPTQASPPAAEVASAPEAAPHELAMNHAQQPEPPAMAHRKERARELRNEQIAGASTLASEQKTKSLAANAYSRAAGGASSAIGRSVAAPEALVMISPPERPAMSMQSAPAPSGAANGSVAGAGSAIGAAVAAPGASNSLQQRGPIWMAGKHGTILFRGADGSTRPQHSGVETDLTAGAAPSATVCWIVGRNGTILRTVDGENWTKIAPPTDADLTEVVANSAEWAIVKTAAGQIFSTMDGGKTWYPD
jgi:hypothetical protein